MTREMRLITLCLIYVGCSYVSFASAFVSPSVTNSKHIAQPEKRAIIRAGAAFNFDLRIRDIRLYNKLSDFLTPYESKIPEELREEIYQAEANTEAARDRGTRVALYTVVAIFAIGLASFNGFLTDMRDKESAIALTTAATTIPDTGNNLYILEKNGFGWVLTNPLFKFLFTNKIGGVLSLLLGGGSGLMAEAELDTKRINAEKIYEELERRREQKLKKQTRGNGGSSKKGKKKRRSGKEKKRLAAISEVVMDEAPVVTAETATKNTPPDGIPVMPPSGDESVNNSNTDGSTDESNDKGIFGKMKDLYERADSMAASQALIMNKNLEEAGVVEKITDETGLKVIGREEAKKLEEKKEKDD